MYAANGKSAPEVQAELAKERLQAEQALVHMHAAAKGVSAGPVMQTVRCSAMYAANGKSSPEVQAELAKERLQAEQALIKMHTAAKCVSAGPVVPVSLLQAAALLRTVATVRLQLQLHALVNMHTVQHVFFMNVMCLLGQSCLSVCCRLLTCWRGWPPSLPQLQPVYAQQPMHAEPACAKSSSYCFCPLLSPSPSTPCDTTNHTLSSYRVKTKVACMLIFGANAAAAAATAARPPDSPETAVAGGIGPFFAAPHWEDLATSGCAQAAVPTALSSRTACRWQHMVHAGIWLHGWPYARQ